MAPANTKPTIRQRVALGAAALGLALLFATATARADDVSVAVAANFIEPMHELDYAFEHRTGHRLRLSSGSTGSLYNQIRNGAPFDVFLAADAARPEALEAEGFGVPGTRFAYALGTLVLWSADPELLANGGTAVLEAGDFRHLAIANPRTAPYGAAALQAIEALGLSEELTPKLVQGQSVAQAFQFALSGSAELAFVALSTVLSAERNGVAEGSHWPVPSALYAPIVQEALLLKRAEGNDAARALIDFLKGDEARAIIRASGYALP